MNLNGLKTNRILANLVGGMLFVQVVLGGASVLLSFPVGYHIGWGIVTFIVLVIATLLFAKDYGTKSTLFKVAIASIADYVVQGILGVFSLSSDIVVVVHLTNAFLLAVIVTYLISFADSADRASVQRRMTEVGPSPKL